MSDLEDEFGDKVEKYSAEIYDLMCQSISGEPLQIIRAVDDMEGLDAWAKLAGKYSPKSLAIAVRLVGMVTNPPRVTDLSKAEMELDKWEDMVKTLRRDFKDNFSDTVKVGIVTTMMPTSVQELIYQSIGKTICYEDVVQKVRAVVSNKVAMAAGKGPSPMDVGEIQHKFYYDAYGGCEDEDDASNEVGAVSANTQCHVCGGWGHMKRECPSALATKGKGKGRGKGPVHDCSKGRATWGKGGAKGSSATATKGAAKGSFKGTCFSCGKSGHRAAECQTRHANAVEETEGENEEAQLGGIWAVGAEDEMRPKFTKKAMLAPPGLGRTKIATRNSFKVLEETEDELEIMAVDPALPLTRLSSIEFNVADVRSPLALAAKMVRNGNRLVLDEAGSYIMNKTTGECMEVKVKDETFVFDVQFESGEQGTITLDSGEGVHVWPKDKLKEAPTLPKKEGLRMCAANGSEIKNHGRKLIKFRGNDFSRAIAESQGFPRQA